MNLKPAGNLRDGLIASMRFQGYLGLGRAGVMAMRDCGHLIRRQTFDLRRGYRSLTVGLTHLSSFWGPPQRITNCFRR